MRSFLHIMSLAVIFTAFSIRPGYSQCSLTEKVYIAEEKRDPGVNKVEEAIKIHNVLNILDLNKEQLAFVVSKAKEIKKISRQHYRNYLRHSGEMLPFIIKIEQQVSAGRTSPDKAVLKGYFENKKKCNLAYYKLNDAVEAGVKAVEGQLKDFQLAALDNYFPCVIPIFNNNLIGAPDSSIGLGYILMWTREMPETRYREEKDSLVANNMALLKTEFCLCQRTCEESIVRKEMSKAMDEVRKLDDVDFRLNMDRLAKELEKKIILKDPEPGRAQKIQRFLLSSQSIPILEKRLSGKK